MNRNSDKDYLLKSLDNENNSSIGNLNSKLIKSMKNDYLQQLQLSRDKLKEYHKKLKDYRYVDDLSNIQYGRYIRWINLTDPHNLKLTTGGIIIDIKICESGIHLICKNFKNHKFQIRINECFIFQKITEQEKIILFALDYLEK